MSCPFCGEPQAGDEPICPRCGKPHLRPIAAREVALTDQTGHQFRLQPGVSRIGRDPASNEIVLMDSSVSARHAAIEVSQDAIVLRDLGSTNGTQINGEPARQAVQLQVGDSVSFGDRQFTVTRPETSHPRAPRGIPVPISPPRQRTDTASTGAHLPAALATIALTLLAIMLQAVGLADGWQRDDLPLPPAVLLAGLVILPVAAIALIAANRRSGYLVAAAAALAGLAFIAVSGPMFAGSSVRNEMTGEYGSGGYWFVAVTAVAALIVEMLVLTVAMAGWRSLQPARISTAPAAHG